MHGCTSGIVLLVDAEFDSMGGTVDSGAGISSTPSLHQSSDLEKTQAELRQTFATAEKFRRELEFLQKGGDPLDLKPGIAALISFQSTSLTDRHPEQFVTSEAKGSFAITASTHGDSVESSGRLGAASVCEPNSADNLMLFDGDNKFHEIEKRSGHRLVNNANVDYITKESADSAVLELPKKSYKRRVRSRPNRDGARSSSTDAVTPRGGHFLPFRSASRDFKASVHDADNQERNHLNSSSKPKSPNAGVALKNSVSHSNNELDGVPTVQSAVGPAHGSYSAALDSNALLNAQENHHGQPKKSDGREAPVAMASIQSEFLKGMEHVHLTDSKCLLDADKETPKDLELPVKNTKEINSRPDNSHTVSVISTKVLDSESSCTQTSQRFDGYNGNGLSTSARLGHYMGTMVHNLVSKEVDVEGNELIPKKDNNILNIDKANAEICHPNCNEDGAAFKEEEGLKGSESFLQNELKNAISTERKRGNILGPQGSYEVLIQESTLSVKQSTDLSEQNACSQKNLKLLTREREDSILEKARIIEAKRKRIAELSVRALPLERRLKSQWDFVLEEMSWLANDFVQERIWKLTAAAQISRRAAFSSQVRFQQQTSLQKPKEVAHTLAEAVMQFWHMIQMKCEELDPHCLKKDSVIGIQRYAIKFLEYNSSQAQYNATRAPEAPDSISNLGMMDLSWEDNLTEENLFYTVPPGAIEAYRKAIESHLRQFERTGTSMHEEVETSGYDAATDNAFGDDERETTTYYLPGVLEGNKSTKNAQKRRKNFKFYGARSYEMGGDLQSVEKTVGTQPSVFSGKRPASSVNVSIPTKRVRTASRQRIMSPFNAGNSGGIHVPNRTDASSGDTNSFQDEQSTLHIGSQIPNNMEADSVGDYEKQLQLDSMEVSNGHKKKKKAKHLGSMYEHRWQLDSNFQNDQKDHSRRRLDTHQFDSNGSSVASQMSNMSNPNKIMKLLVRDRGRKAKSLKTPVGQPGSGSPWSLFEDQALVVLVHDMGPNWELISDAINSTLQFKCIFRKSRECKERHKVLMDRNTGDGADSAEDSGSSQPYPSTLPGIPEGSARQLFQRLQGPMEEDTLKSHFEKIIMIGQKQHYRRLQNENQDPKQLQQPHSSHAFALSQVCPNNLNDGPVLTPLELCEAISSTPDVLAVGYQGPRSGGLPGLSHGTTAPMLPGSGSASTSLVPGSSNSIHGSNIPSASAPLNPSVRDGRYGIPRSGSLSVDDQHRMQQMLSARNMQQSNLALGSHPVTDRGARLLPTGNSVGGIYGLNRNVKMARPGFQGIPSPSMLSSGSVLSPGTTTPSSVSMHSGGGPGQGSALLKSHDPMNMIRPNQNTDQMQQSSQGGATRSIVPASSYPLHHPQQPHPHSHHFQGPTTSTQHPAYGMRFAKERQLQQHRLIQQQQFPTSNPMMPPVPPLESQLPVSQMQSQSQFPVSQKHSVPALRNPQTSGTQMGKQQRRQLQQFQPPERMVPPQQQAKLMKGGRGPMSPIMMHQNLPTDPSLSNGGVFGSNPKAYTGQIQAASSKQLQNKPSNSSDNSSSQNHVPLTSANHFQHQSPQNQKLGRQKPATTPQKMTNNQKVYLSDQPTESHTSPVNSPTNTAGTMPNAPNSSETETPVSRDLQQKTSKMLCDSSGVTSDDAETETKFGKNSEQLSPPQTVGVGMECEHAESAARSDTGVQWQNQQQKSPS